MLKTGQLFTKEVFDRTQNFAKKFDDSSVNNEIDQNYTRIQEIIETIYQKIQKTLKENENEFFVAYRDQMVKIQAELRALKKRIDEETLRQKRDEKIKVLMQERDYFRREAIKLDSICKDQEKKIKESKILNKVMNEDKSYYEAFILDIKKENKLLKAELLLKNGEAREPALKEAEKNRSFKHKEGEPNNVEVIENDRMFPAIKEKSSEVQFMTQPAILFEEAKKPKSKEPNTAKKAGRNAETIAELNAKIKTLTTENQGFRESIEKYKGFIHNLELKLENEQKNIKKIRKEISTKIMERTELEQTLLECINEAKKVVRKRKKELIAKKTTSIEEIDYTQFKTSDKTKLVHDLMSNDRVLEKLYEVVFSPKGDTPKDPNDLEQSTAKLTEYWKMEAEQLESKYHRFNLLKKSLLHNSLSESSNKNFDFSKSLNNFSSRALSLKQKIMDNIEKE